jgi:hypothetical protein
MALPTRKKPSVTQVLRLVDQLSPKEQAQLRQAFLEDQEDIRIAEKRLKSIRSSRTKTIPLEKIMKEYGLES